MVGHIIPGCHMVNVRHTLRWAGDFILGGDLNQSARPGLSRCNLCRTTDLFRQSGQAVQIREGEEEGVEKLRIECRQGGTGGITPARDGAGIAVAGITNSIGHHLIHLLNAV